MHDSWGTPIVNAFIDDGTLDVLITSFSFNPPPFFMGSKDGVFKTINIPIDL
jgi:hypothetical protein